MGRELTRRHSLLFEKKGVRNLFSLFNDLYRYQKWSELISFTVWELFHKLRLFPKKKYLRFNNREGLTLENERLNSLDFSEKIDHLFRSRDLIATRSNLNWKLLFIKKDGEIIGCQYPDDKELYRSTDQGKTIVRVQRFPEQIKSIFVSSQNTIFVCAKGAVYKSSDNGGSFIKTLDLGSSESFFRHNNAMTETPDMTLLIGEYGNVWEKRGWRKLAYLYSSSDGGETWERSDFLITQGINKHVHLVKYSRLFDRVLMADGDNKKKLWVSEPVNSSFSINSNRWKPVNKFHIQMGGYTSIVESDGKILFGTDYQGGTNFIVETTDCKKFTKRIVPDPYRRSPIDNMAQRKSKKGNEVWANLPYSTANTKCLLMYTDDGGESWNKVIEYNRATHKVWLLSSSNETSDVLYISIEDSIDKNRVVYRIAGD
ncbi:MAG TPA: exo-alpha-sialidase [Patescibacteria group bacterium]|nr:exo-alpha-sialidase [Patescibacteria group bacterium]